MSVLDQARCACLALLLKVEYSTMGSRSVAQAMDMDIRAERSKEEKEEDRAGELAASMRGIVNNIVHCFSLCAEMSHLKPGCSSRRNDWTLSLLRRESRRRQKQSPRMKKSSRTIGRQKGSNTRPSKTEGLFVFDECIHVSTSSFGLGECGFCLCGL